MTLLKIHGQDKNVLQQRWKQKQEILETDVPTNFTIIKLGLPIRIWLFSQRKKTSNHISWHFEYQFH